MDSLDIQDRTPLSWAAVFGQEAVVKLLLSRDDVAVDSRDYRCRRPLDLAKENGHDAVVKLLEDKMGEASSVPRKRRIEEVSDDEELQTTRFSGDD